MRIKGAVLSSENNFISLCCPRRPRLAADNSACRKRAARNGDRIIVDGGAVLADTAVDGFQVTA